MIYLSYVWRILSSNYGMVAISISNALVFFCFLRPRFKWWFYPVMIVLTYFSLPLFYKFSTELFISPMDYSILMTILGYWNNIMALICFRERFWKMIFLLFTIQILNRLFTFCGYLLQMPLNAILKGYFEVQLSITLVIVLMYSIISLVCWIFLRKKGQELMQTEPHRQYWVVLASITVFAKLIIDFCTSYSFSLNPYSDYKIILAMITLSIFVLAVLMLYFYSTIITMKHLELKASTDRLAFEKESLQRYYETQLFNQEELRRMKHDMNGNLNTILHLLLENKKDEALSYLSGLCDYAERHQKVLYCDDPYLNAIVTNFTEVFAANDTTFELEIQLGEMKMHYMEVCLVLNNGLQNAFEASLKLKPAQRYVRLQIKTKQNRFLLRISNHFTGELDFDGDLPRSIKEDDGHGYGLTSIRKAIESLGGFVVCKIEDDMFVLDVAM